MHEISLINDLIVEAERKGMVKSVVVEVGELALVEAAQVREMLSMRGWGVTVLEKKARVKCACGFVGEPEITAREHEIIFFNCPECGKIPEVEDGDKIMLKEVVV